MDIGVLGVNFRSADLALREKLAKLKLDLANNLSYVVLSTCNRFEIYFSNCELTDAHTKLVNTIKEKLEQDLGYKLYSYFGEHCFNHLCKVTSGLDSAILAETEIQGQVKRAYLKAHQNKQCQKPLHFLFQKSLKMGKEMRQKIPINATSLTLIDTIVTMKKNLLMLYKRPKVLFVGSSEMNYKIIKSLKHQPFVLYLTSRSKKRGELFAKKWNVNYFDFKKIDHWDQFQGVVLATRYNNFVITKSSDLQEKKLLIDLSVPRNVDPKLNADQNITLFNIDQLNKIVRKKRRLPSWFNLDYFVEKEVSKQIRIYKRKITYLSSLKLAI